MEACRQTPKVDIGLISRHNQAGPIGRVDHEVLGSDAFPCFIDFEASSLEHNSYPIEVAWSDADGRIESWLIDTSGVPSWTDWDDRVQQGMHGPLARDASTSRPLAKLGRATIERGLDRSNPLLRRWPLRPLLVVSPVPSRRCPPGVQAGRCRRTVRAISGARVVDRARAKGTEFGKPSPPGSPGRPLPAAALAVDPDGVRRGAPGGEKEGERWRYG